MGGIKKRKSDEPVACVGFVVPKVPPLRLAIQYRDVYVSFSSGLNESVVSLKDDSDGGVYRTPAAALGDGPLTRIHYLNTAGDMKFSENFKRTIEQVHVNLYLREGKRRTVAVQLEELWRLIGSFERCAIKKMVIRLGEPEDCAALEVGDRIGECMIYDDSLFFDVAKVTRLLRLFDVVEMHVKCNAIQEENVRELIEFFESFIINRRLLIYISEFQLFLKTICVTERDGKFKSLNVKVKVTQIDRLVTLRIGSVRIKFEDEFRALEFRNYE